MKLGTWWSPTPLPRAQHTHTPQQQVIPWRWALLASGVQGLYRGMLHEDKMGEKDVENYWFGVKVILAWHNHCRKPQTSPTLQGLGDSCPSHLPCDAPRETEAWSLFYSRFPHWASRHTTAPAAADKDHAVVMVWRSITYGLAMGSLWMLPSPYKDPKHPWSSSGLTIPALPTRRVRVHTEWPVHGQQAWALSPSTLWHLSS